MPKKTVKEGFPLLFKKFQIEWVPIGEIKLWGTNPRINTKEAKELAKIIKAHNLRSPIICDKETKRIYKGNTTYKALKILKAKTVPVIFHDFSSKTAAEAYGIADNKAGELTSWDNEALMKLMGTPEFKKLDTVTGFTDTEMKLLQTPEKGKEKEKPLKKKKVIKNKMGFLRFLEQLLINFPITEDEVKNILRSSGELRTVGVSADDILSRKLKKVKK